jgi:thiol-disulfide isomerase/thioredoxin
MQEQLKNKTIDYFTEVETDQAFQLAKQRHVPVFVDFWAPNCKGCQKMEHSTYQNADTLPYIEEHFVFVKYDITNRNVPKMQSSPILWTPTFIVFANDGSEVRKTIGYLNKEQLQAELTIGRALAFLRKAQPGTALTILETFITSTAPENSIPEALYWAGVMSYFFNKRNADSLVPHWGRLIKDYSGSIWAEKADCLNISL